MNKIIFMSWEDLIDKSSIKTVFSKDELFFIKKNIIDYFWDEIDVSLIENISISNNNIVFTINWVVYTCPSIDKFDLPLYQSIIKERCDFILK